MKPVDVYVRVSRVGGRERLISPDEQERKARDLARERGLKIGKVLTDLDESGGKLERPGLQEALRRVEEGKSGGIIVAWLDRLSRDSEHAHGLVRRISEAGGSIYAPDAPSDWTTPEGELQAGIVFAFATYVRKRARAGFERAKEQAIARGIPVQTRPAVGYRRREDRTLEPDPKVAPIVREVFERRAQGEGPASLGRFLESQGVSTSQGSKTWSKQAVYHLLRNRIYLGELSYGRDGRFTNPDSHEPIVDLATWQAAQHPNGRRLTPARSENSPFLLTGLIRCAACRYCLNATTSGHGHRIYRCTRTHSGGVCPEPARMRAEPVEAAAVEAFWTLTMDLEAVGHEDDSGDDLAALEEALERAKRRLEQALSSEVQDAAGDAWAPMVAERRKEVERAADELGKARSEAATRTALPDVETLRSAWERMSTQERRELLSLRFDCITLGRDKTMVVYPAGTGPGELPRRGFKRAPLLEPFPPPPDGARLLNVTPS